MLFVVLIYTEPLNRTNKQTKVILMSPQTNVLKQVGSVYPIENSAENDKRYFPIISSLI